MRYYLLAAGKAQGPFDEEEVVQAYEDGDIDESAQVLPEAGQDWMPLGSILSGGEDAQTGYSRIDTAGVAGSPASARLHLSPRLYLKELRRETCYPVLRTVLDVSAILAAVSVILWWLAPIAAMVLHRPFLGIGATSGPVTVALAILLNTLVSALAMIVILGCRQAAFVFVDTADTLIARHAKEASTEEA